MSGTRSSSSSPPPSSPPMGATATVDGTLGLDGIHSTLDMVENLGTVNGNGVNVNGKHPVRSPPNSVSLTPAEIIEKLRIELKKTAEEKESLSEQYHTLLARLNSMRTSVSNKLKQDAEELDRREQMVHQLTAQNDELVNSLDALKQEVLTSNAEAERYSRELTELRSKANQIQDTAHESMVREQEVRELQSELERCTIEKEECGRTALRERVRCEEVKATLQSVRKELEIERAGREREKKELEVERERTANLQSVLEDFQAAKDHELRQAVSENETRLNQVTQSLAEYKHRALSAELALEETSADSSKIDTLEKGLKEKTLLIGKLRHEAVVLNEYLGEALRRLRKNSPENNVDRRLVTNVLLQFLPLPREDTKRFEMLSLMANILSWSDSERERAGLQKGSGLLRPKMSGSWGRSTPTPMNRGSMDSEKSEATESFSQMWVEFLLRESATGTDSSAASSTLSPPRSPGSLSLTPTSQPTSPLPSPSPSKLRLPSFGVLGSHPDLTKLHQLNPPPP